MFLWPVIVLACGEVGNWMHSESPYYIATYIASPIYTAILVVIALRHCSITRRFLRWLAAIILIVAVYIGQMYYFDSLQHGWKWVESATRSPIVWLDGVLVVLSVLYVVLPSRAWGWMKSSLVRGWKKAG